MTDLDLSSLREPEERFELLRLLHEGFDAQVWEAKDNERDGSLVAIKIFKDVEKRIHAAEAEFTILSTFPLNPVFPTLFGTFLRRSTSESGEATADLWLVMENLSNGTALDLVKGFSIREKRLREEHIAFILREIITALADMHAKGMVHRDLKASNIMIDSQGDVKLIDFASSKILSDPEDKMTDVLMSPHWAAPEVFRCLPNVLVTPMRSSFDQDEEDLAQGYDSRVDVWALGILAIELCDAAPPLSEVHPSRALFQIVRNPPPTMVRETDWPEEFLDFIAECLTCNPEYRPVLEELKEHPFIATVPTKDIHLRSELRLLTEENSSEDKVDRCLELKICPDSRLRTKATDIGEDIFPDDLARVPSVDEETVLSILRNRFLKNMPNTFVGDVLLATDGLEGSDYSGKYDPERYMFRALSDNEPHVMAVADKAWQEMLHHKLPQLIVLSGESGSGKTGHFNLLTHHLCRIGHGNRLLISKIQQLNCVLNAFMSAPTKVNPAGSTRAIHLQEITFSKSGKSTGANNWIYGLDVNHLIPERFRKGDGTFLIFYYFYHGMAQMGYLERYRLDPNQCYKILAPYSKNSDPEQHAAYMGIVQSALKVLDLSQMETENIFRMLAVVMNLSQVVVDVDKDGGCILRSVEHLHRAAALLEVDQERLAMSITHELDHAGVPSARKRQDEAKKHLHSLITCLYCRLLDWLVHILNTSFSLSRKVFGDEYSVGLLDHYGYEDVPGENGLSQVFVNTVNDFMQYYYNQQMFVKELGDLESEGITVPGQIAYKDIRSIVDFVLHGSHGLLKAIDTRTITNRAGSILDDLAEMTSTCAEGIMTVQSAKSSFQLLHANKPVTYSNCTRFQKENSAFLADQIATVITSSRSKLVRALFAAKIRLTGGLVVTEPCSFLSGANTPMASFTAPILEVEGCTLPSKSKNMPTCSRKGFSQTKRQLTRATMCRAALMSLMQKMVVCSPHFVRCIRPSDHAGEVPLELNLDVVSRQLKHLGVMETLKLRKVGYSSRIPFYEFLRRYKFLVFDFEETVDENEENCRLLFLRLRIDDGWSLGRTKVCLKYYLEEYLSRLYEKEVRKIIKIQAMVRRYLARLKEKKLIDDRKRKKRQRTKHYKFGEGVTEDEAAVKLQKAFRGFKVRKDLKKNNDDDNKRTLVSSPGGMRIDIAHYWRKWRSRTIFQQLQRYRSANVEQLIYFSQQVHLYGQDVNSVIRRWNDSVDLGRVEEKNLLKPSSVLRSISPRPLHKVPLRLADVMYIDTSHLRDPFGSRGLRTPTSPVRTPSPAFPEVDGDDWDAPLRDVMSLLPSEISTLQTIEHVKDWKDVMMMKSPSYNNGHSSRMNSVSPMNAGSSPRGMLSPAALNRSPGFAASPTRLTASPTVSPKPGTPTSAPPQAPAPPVIRRMSPMSNEAKPAAWRNSNPVAAASAVGPILSPRVAIPGPECLSDMRNRLRKTDTGKALCLDSDTHQASASEASRNAVYKRPKTLPVTPCNSQQIDDPETPPFNFQGMLRKTNLLKLVSTEDEDTFCALDTPPVAPPRSSRTPSPRTKPGNNPSPRAAGPHHHHHHPHQPDSGSPEDPTRRDSVASSAAASVQLGIDSRRSSGSNRTPTPTLVYQPSSVSDGGDDDDELLPTVMALTPTRIVFDDDNEVTF